MNLPRGHAIYSKKRELLSSGLFDTNKQTNKQEHKLNIYLYYLV